MRKRAIGAQSSWDIRRGAVIIQHVLRQEHTQVGFFPVQDNTLTGWS